MVLIVAIVVVVAVMIMLIVVVVGVVGVVVVMLVRFMFVLWQQCPAQWGTARASLWAPWKRRRVRRRGHGGCAIQLRATGTRRQTPA